MHLFGKLTSRDYEALDPVAKICLDLSQQLLVLKNEALEMFFKAHYPFYKISEELDRVEIAKRGRFAVPNRIQDGILETFHWDGKPIFALVQTGPYQYAICFNKGYARNLRGAVQSAGETANDPTGEPV